MSRMKDMYMDIVDMIEAGCSSSWITHEVVESYDMTPSEAQSYISFVRSQLVYDEHDCAYD